MNPGYPPDPASGQRSTEHKGSVRRAREMLESGRRPRVQAPPKPQPGLQRPPPYRVDPAHMTQWPLPGSGAMPPQQVDPQGRLFVPRGPPPQRPPRPDAPSPSVYSERSLSDAEPSPLHLGRSVPSFSQPRPPQQPPPLRPVIRVPIPPRPTSDADSTPRVSVATDELLRRSAASTASIPSIPDFPAPTLPLPAEDNTIPKHVPRRPPNLAPPPHTSRSFINRRSSVSPIPEEISESPIVPRNAYPSSRAVVPSWASAQAESDILGTYLDADSSEDSSESPPSGEDHGPTLVRQASLGKRGKPSLRTIQRATTESLAPPAGNHPGDVKQPSSPGVEPSGAPQQKDDSGGPKDNRGSASSSSTASSHFDWEKAPVVVNIGRPPRHDSPALEKELGGALPLAAPTMSDKRPGGRRPPRLNMDAVRDAEARGSLTSLPDLIRRATKLATNLEHGRTASRNDLLNFGGSKYPQGQNRKSGSLKDILASFPPPASTPQGGRSSWPTFFGRSQLHHLHSNDEAEANDEKSTKRSRRCCGMPLWLFILLLIVFIIIVLCAVLIPVFLVVVPQHKNSRITSLASHSECGSSSPCENGGVSVSSGDVCSCVCTNGFTGSRCTVAGDASCIATEIQDGSSSRNATMGDQLPRLFGDIKSDFGIPLDPVTIMALFSQNDVSCTTENALIAFRGVSTGANKRDLPTVTLSARGPATTEDGIVFDHPVKKQQESDSTDKEDPPEESPSKTSTASSAHHTPAAISDKTLDFARVAVLYILEKTGAFDAALFTEDRIESYLRDRYPAKKEKYVIDLEESGVSATYTLNFDGYQISTPGGTVVGGG
ncbi:hypothetical protein BDW42DRAFT_83296 [Aspergillus taichungensis]|uniref:EGF-like domain-containing protein n=1 Tax=Aspergillus taichungensis TaxID=482145 RepID=A0A2J5HXW0_9EURO|nr:hypothetical protein BDW42DRAFT_83296 [Aspergillus taichungensis]